MRIRITALAFTCGLLGTAVPILAQSTWTGGDANDANWSRPANWGGTAPVPLATPLAALVFAGGARTNTTNDFPADSIFGSITFHNAAAAFTLDGSVITLGGNIGFNANPASPVTHTINLGLRLNAARQIQAFPNGTITVSGNITQDSTTARNLNIAGSAASGKVMLTGSNSFTGELMVFTWATASISSLANASSTSAAGAGSWLRLGNGISDGTIEYTGGTVSTNRQIQVGSTNGTATQVGAGAFLNNGSGTVTFTNPLFNRTAGGTVVLSRTAELGGSGDIVVEGVIRDNSGSSSVALRKSGAGMLTLSAAATYTGATTINRGILKISTADNRLPVTTAVTLANAAGTTFDLNNLNQMIGSLAGGGTVSLGSGTLTVGDATSTSFSGAISGTGGSLVKQGTGTLALTGTNTYNGSTLVSEGALVIHGSLAGGTVTVGGGASLSGSGTVAGDIVFADHAGLGFDSSSTLTVQGGTIDLGTLGIENIVGLDYSAALGTYTLIAGGATLDLSGVRNLGPDDACYIKGGKSAYLRQAQDGSLQLVVQIDSRGLGPVAIGMTPDGSHAVLSWTGEDGVFYGVQESSTLAPDDWHKVATSLRGQGEMLSRTVDAPADRGFFRVFAAGEQLLANEAVVFCSDLQPRSARLLFRPTEVVSVVKAGSGQVFAPGVDYTMDADGLITLTPTSSIPVLDYYATSGDATYYRFIDISTNPQKYFYSPGGTHKHVGYDVLVTYKHAGESLDDLAKNTWATKLTTARTRLNAKQPLNVTFFGDSITYGGQSSIPELAYAPRIVEGLKTRFGYADVQYANKAVGGTTSDWGRQEIQQVIDTAPDLAVLAFGMNDSSGNTPAATYKANTDAMIQALRAANPDVSIVLVAEFSPNPNWENAHYALRAQCREALFELFASYDNIAFADIGAVSRAVAARKKFQDFSGNCLNHPNDFLHWIYAQVISNVFGPDPGGAAAIDPTR